MPVNSCSVPSITIFDRSSEVTINVGEASVVVLDILDSIIPGLLSIVLVFVLMKLIKKGYKPLTLVFGILILSIVLAFLGIF